MIKGFFAVSVLVLIVLFAFVFPFTGLMPNYSDGQRTGDVYKFSYKGIFFKSWEGEMYLGGVHSTGGDNPSLEMDKFYFSIPDSQADGKADIIAKIKECAEKRATCTIDYKQWFIGPVTMDSGYSVTNVQIKNQ